MSVLDALKSAVNLARQIDNIPLQQSILDLQAAALEMVEEDRALKDANRALQEQLARRQALVSPRGDGCFIVEGGDPDVPICPHCYMETGLQFPVVDDHSMLFCNTCGKQYTVAWQKRVQKLSSGE